MDAFYYKVNNISIRVFFSLFLACFYQVERNSRVLKTETCSLHLRIINIG